MGLLKHWTNKRKERLQREGFEYAAGALLDKSESIETLENYVDTAKSFHEYNDFDRGVEQAIKLWKEKEGK